MDCPGLFDSQASDEDVATTILQALSGMEPGPDVIGYVIAINRYTEEEFGAYRRLKALLDDVTDYMVIVLTHGDRLKGEDVWNKLQQAPSHLQKVLEECGHRVVVLDNTSQRGKQSQVKRLVREARKLKNQNHRRPYTLELDDDAETEAQERLLRVEKMENRRKALVRKLIRKKAVAEENLIAERQSWTKRHQELEESCRKKERVLKNKKKDLSGKLRDQKELNAELENQIEALEEELREQRRVHFRH